MALTQITGSGVGQVTDIKLGGSGSANTLDDYEEGTWTPAFDNVSGFSSSSISSIDARYTKIGRQVTLQFKLTADSSSGNVAAGDDIVLTVGSLPFTPDLNGHANGTMGVQASMGTGENVAMGYIGLSADNKLGLVVHTVDGTVSRATSLGGVFTYFTA